MLVYGDHCESVDTGEWLGRIGHALSTVAAMPAGIDRHAKLVGTLVEAGQLLQGVEDAGASAEVLRLFLYRLSHCVIGSMDSQLRHIGELPPVPTQGLPEFIEVKLPEGFAFYAVYPEAYVAAARRLKLLGSPRVIGIRSIGTTLGAVVAAAIGAPPPNTVRPFGDPFARRVELPDELVDQSAHYVIVDEGPGLSGSSFGAVADWLQERGVGIDRIAFLPSHDGEPGPRASAAHRVRWLASQRVPAEFNPSFLERSLGGLTPFSTGEAGERLKFLVSRDGERLLVKFAGLGSIGEAKLAMARDLHWAGLAAEPLGLIHGFLVERWCGDARPLGPGEQPIEEIGNYIGARANLFPAPESGGATLDELESMCRHNIAVAFGEPAAALVHRFSIAWAGQQPRVRIDGKLDRCEWLRERSGKLIKTDALDHHCSHDLIGCQPVEWDVAGAAAEFELDECQISRLINAAGVHVDARQLGFFRCAYLAFRLGRAVLLGSGESGRYHRQLTLLLGSSLSESARILA